MFANLFLCDKSRNQGVKPLSAKGTKGSGGKSRHELQNSAPIFRAKSPLRVSFAGSGTDYPHWFRDQPGAVLCSTIARYARVSLYRRDDDQIRLRSVDLGREVFYRVGEQPVYNGMLDLAQAAIARMGSQDGMDLDIQCDVLPGSGLGGSSALVSSVLGAVAASQHQRFTLRELAELNYVVEHEDLHIPGGMQDQYATTFGGFNLIEFSDREVNVVPLPLRKMVVEDLEAHLMMCEVGQTGTSDCLMSKEIRCVQEGRPEMIQGMRRLYLLVYEMKSLLMRGKMPSFGELLHEEFMNKKQMNPEITSGTRVDELYEIALRQGASGGKLMGAGGGYLLLYCPTHAQHRVREALEQAGSRITHCIFDRRGLRVWPSFWR